MKILTILGVLVIVFTSCAVLTPQETQQERQRLLKAYNEARQRHNPERVKDAVKDLLVGKWQYVGLEVEEGSVSVQQTLTSTTDLVQNPSEVPADTQAAPSEQTETAKADGQSSEADATRLPRIEVTDEKSSQQILAAKAALTASTRQNLTIEFFPDRGSYHYNGTNRGTNVTGQCYVTTKRYGDDQFPFIRFNRRTGPELLEFLFGSEPVKQMAAKQKQKRAAMLRNRQMGIQGARKAAARQTSFTIASMAGITVTEDTLSLVLYGDMKLTPTGWMRTGGLRCTFRRVE